MDCIYYLSVYTREELVFIITILPSVHEEHQLHLYTWAAAGEGSDLG